MDGSSHRRRPRWEDLPATVRDAVQHLIGGPVAHAANCPGGFSPGFASRLTRADGRRRFVKAIDADTWPLELAAYRSEAKVGAALPVTVPAPRLLGVYDDGHWCVLAFQDVDGAPPGPPWTPGDIGRVVRAVADLARAATPSPVALPGEHPRLGGWAALRADPTRVAALRQHAPWAAGELPRLVELERAGLAAARGDSLVHGDLYPHNILLEGDRVVFVDWPHARRGAPVIDLVTFLSSVAADGVDPQPYVEAGAEVTGVLTAHAGFLLAGGLSAPQRGLEAITAAKLRLGLGALQWLRHRL